MIREVFHHWLYCFHLGLRSPFSLCQAGVIFPPYWLQKPPKRIPQQAPKGPNFSTFILPSFLFSLRREIVSRTFSSMMNFWSSFSQKPPKKGKANFWRSFSHKENPLSLSLSNFRWSSAGSRSRLKSRRSGARRRNSCRQ